MASSIQTTTAAVTRDRSNSNPAIISRPRKEDGDNVTMAATAVLKSQSDTLTKPWHERIIIKLQTQETVLKKTPDFAFQKRLDLVGRYIKNKFTPLEQFNDWLNKNGEGEWYKKLATYLAKLPVRSIRNIVQLLYKIISGILSFGVHPLVGSLELAQLMVKLVHALTQPETLSKIGVGVMGSALGQVVIVPSPVAYIGLIIGAALSLSGLSLGVLKTAYQAKSGEKTAAVKNYLTKLLPELPEVFLTAFLISMAVTGIRQAIMKSQPVTQAHLNQSITQTQADQFALEYAQKNHIPTPTSVEVTGDGNIIMSWKGTDVYALEKECIEIARYDFASVLEFDPQTHQWKLVGWDPDPEFAYMDKFAITIPHNDPTLATFQTSGLRGVYYEYSEGIPVGDGGPIEWHGEFPINNANAPLPLTSPDFPQLPTPSAVPTPTLDPTVDLATYATIGIIAPIKV